jgi:hypothetical protein
MGEGGRIMMKTIMLGLLLSCSQVLAEEPSATPPPDLVMPSFSLPVPPWLIDKNIWHPVGPPPSSSSVLGPVPYAPEIKPAIDYGRLEKRLSTKRYPIVRWEIPPPQKWRSAEEIDPNIIPK